MSLPNTVKNAYQALGPHQQKAFRKEYGRRKRSMFVSGLAWLMLGWHYLYFGKAGMQFAFWFTAGGMGVWWLVDLFRLPGMVKTANEDLARELMVQHKSLG